jgi:hypothetical protein
LGVNFLTELEFDVPVPVGFGLLNPVPRLTKLGVNFFTELEFDVPVGFELLKSCDVLLIFTLLCFPKFELVETVGSKLFEKNLFLQETQEHGRAD